jgi:hypothetical protein
MRKTEDKKDVIHTKRVKRDKGKKEMRKTKETKD